MVNYFLYRLLPPRATFPGDITADEGAAMQAHVQYLTGLLNEGAVVAFGPVAGPQGVYGIAIIEATEGRDVNEIAANDPVIKSDLGFTFEMLPMLSAVVRPAAS
jgi:uncharacterized protein YciI